MLLVDKRVTYPRRKVAGNFMGFSFHYSKILLAKCPKIESSFLGLPERILLFSAMVTSLLLTLSSLYFPRVREINWHFQDLSKKSQKNHSQYTSGETPTIYFQSSNGWFDTVSDEFPFSALLDIPISLDPRPMTCWKKENNYFEGWLDSH